jgi:hypothetical protein
MGVAVLRLKALKHLYKLSVTPKNVSDNSGKY